MDSTVKTPDGVGTVCEIAPLTGMIKVKLKDTDGLPKSYHRDNVKELSRPHRKEKNEDKDTESE